MIREIRIALGHAVESGLGTEHGEPWSPHVGRHQITSGAAVKRDLQEVARVQPKDRTAIGGQVSDLGKSCGNAAGRLEGRRVEKMVDLSCPVVPAVDS